MKKMILISGPIIAICVMMGTAISSSLGNIKHGALLGFLTGFAITSAMIVWKYYKEKKNQKDS